MKAKPVADSKQKAGIILLAGFLGAGKTTLLKRVLSWEEDLSDSVVLVNEFGDIGIDGALLKDSGSDVIELTSGCICCTLSADLKQSLEDIWKRFKPRRIFIESSGVADPAAVVTTLTEPLLTRSMRLEKVLTVLDADFWEAREVFGPLFYSQLEMADLILLNKIDTQDENKIGEYLREMHEVFPKAQIVPTIRCNIDSEILWAEAGKSRFEHAPARLFNEILPISDEHGLSDEHDHPEHQGEGVHHQGTDASHFVTFSFETAKTMSESRFKKFLSELPFALFRLKGPVRFSDRTTLINFVGGRSEWTAWEGNPETRLAMIGWTVDQNGILSDLKQCIVE